MVSYKKLWKLLIDKNINKKKLIEKTGISTSSMAKLTKGANVTTDVLCKSVNILSVILAI
nr:helix-turn-helix transcriptional regulator [Metamycoplasma hominis]